MQWIPLRHQLDILRMDIQYTLRQVYDKTKDGKPYKAGDDALIRVLYWNGLIKPLNEVQEKRIIGGGALVAITPFGKLLMANDHALRELAIEWMDFFDKEQIELLRHGYTDWPYRDPEVRKFMQALKNEPPDGGPGHADFFPQAPWYYHVIPRKLVPDKLRDRKEEKHYEKSGYNGKAFSAAEMLDGD